MAEGPGNPRRNAARTLIVHYDEIGLKGKNRRFFETRLAENLRRALGPEGVAVRRRHGRLVCEMPAGCDRAPMAERLRRIPGIAYFAFGETVPAEIAAIAQSALRLADVPQAASFGIFTRRSDKRFPLTSQEVNRRVGELVVQRLGKRVDLGRPQVAVFIEICAGEAHLYRQKQRGVGGLPTGSSGAVVVSLSGGLDSPVAAHLMIKRGCRVVFAHLRNRLQAADAAENKIDDLVARLTRSQLSSTLYVVPFEKLQRRIIMWVPAAWRMIVYRRFMMRVCNLVAAREGALAVVTGDSVGQVASQTLENIRCIHGASALPVLSPLIGMNKAEIVEIAREIGTYEISTRPYPDCCAYMIAPHPETRADAGRIAELEVPIADAEQLAAQCVEQAEVRRLVFP